MTTASPITDIHAAEKEAKKKIAHAESQKNSKEIDTRDSEQEKLVTLEEELRTKGKEKIMTAKKAATEKADEKMRSGKLSNESTMTAARNKMDKAVRKGVDTFNAHIGL